MFPLSQSPSTSSRAHGRHSSHSHSSSNNRNYGAAFFQMMTIALLCTSLAQPSWFSLVTRTSAAASKLGESCPRHLTLYQFFDYGYFETGDARNVTSGPTPVRLYYHSATGSKLIMEPVSAFQVPCTNLYPFIPCSYGLPHSSCCQCLQSHPDAGDLCYNLVFHRFPAGCHGNQKPVVSHCESQWLAYHSNRLD